MEKLYPTSTPIVRAMHGIPAACAERRGCGNQRDLHNKPRGTALWMSQFPSSRPSDRNLAILRPEHA